MFFQESFSSSVDFPTYIPWQTLSSDLSDKLKHGSIRINRSNRVEYATIHEEGTPLLENGSRKPEGPITDGSVITEAVKGGTSWPVASFLLVNAALGAGVLNYPFAYDKAGGVYFAALLQVLMMVILISTMLVLVYCADLNGDTTYHDVLLSMCGRRAQQCAALSILLTCFGICITFLIIIGDQYDRLFLSLFEKEFCHSWYLDRRFTISISAFIFILPMCYFQRLDFLRYASSLGIFAMLYPVFLTVYEYYVLGVVPGKIKTVPDSAVQVFVVIPVFSFAYQTHEIVVPVYACMKDRSLKAFTKSTFLAMGFLFFVYCIAGSFGYSTFGNKIAADIMEQYDARDPIVLIGIGALVIKMITTYPQLVVCGRGALDGLYAEFVKLSTDDFIKGEFKRRIVVTSLWFLATVLLAILTPNIGVVIELLGCLASVNIFIFPGICLIALTFREDEYADRFRSKVMYGVASAMIAFGFFVFGVVFSKVIMVDFLGDQPVEQRFKCR
ncbi:sodium-coupled neutral amino acid transporter 7-like isoform X2 [Uloborus diversus]|uniref:sodium-coupled neutral amino acid transporter 7-like isoform X1 n=1 Tax=Uloborus diversus TaxID=327109 RepID=UPI0024094512|nr:sodium-coupled neutral amino acid transporter 7-like isoform X1 [Uloborus diversus]XP_054717184.1 sodium-coupled neutral amino acid transporter 7-like isoform X2 [Uloborus diversus]